MNQLIEKTYSFTEAALAAGMGPKALRNWIDRGLINLEADENRDGDEWRRFTLYDVLRLAATRELVEFGVSVAEAFRIADAILARARMLLMYKNTPANVIKSGFMPLAHLVFPIGKDKWDYYDVAKTELDQKATTLPGVVVINLYVIIGLVFVNLGIE